MLHWQPFGLNAELVDWRSRQLTSEIKPWKPEPLPHASWPPDYRAVYAWRLRQLQELQADPRLLASAKAYYRLHNDEFIMHWMDTYDPRRSGVKWVPFVFFIRQAEFIRFLNECSRDNENGLTEKCRDMGATWLCCGYSVHSWLFNKNDAIGWGSRKQELVDKIGDPSSIFEKLRLLVRRLPKIWHPEGLKERDHLTFMKMVNPENGSVITGETGDNIGRGGRTRIYFKDESAHYERPEKIEASLGDNTNCQIDISSVNGLGNVFHRKREAGIDWKPGHAQLLPGHTRVFVFDWRDHPDKTQEWHDQRKAKAEREGLQHLFAQEVERNYSAAISNTIIPYDWIVASIDAHTKIKWRDAKGNIHIGITPEMIPNNWIAGLDVADGGIDRNALGLRQWIIWRDVEEWGERDPGVTTRRAIQRIRLHQLGRVRSQIKVQYDSIGIGSSVKSEYNRLVDTKDILPNEIAFVGWNAGAAVTQPFFHVIADDDQSPMNKDFFHNFKAQAWWSLRTRFYKTWNNITNGVIYDIDELISLDSSMKLLWQLIKELAQPTSDPGSSLRMVVNKQPDGMKSPNLADAGVMMYFPVIENHGVQITSYGT
jgi:phage terminase large subunit